jgi:hypothetical protein
VRSTESIKSTVPLLVLEQWPIDRLRPYEHNPRKNDKAVNQIRASIREFGFAVPILTKRCVSTCLRHVKG